MRILLWHGRMAEEVVSFFQVSEGCFELTVLVVQMGEDLVVCLFGGETSHWLGCLGSTPPQSA